MNLAADLLTELLEQRSTSSRGRYFYLQDGNKLAHTLGYKELAIHAKGVAIELQKSASIGSRALLLYPPGLDVLPALFGCLYAGVVAVPVPPPDGVRLKRTLPRLQTVVADAEPEVILTTTALWIQLADQLSEALPNVRWLLTDTVDQTGTQTWLQPDISPGNVAYLQYTSGSTSTPRGVMLSHENVLQNLAHLKRGFGSDSSSVFVTWMPYYHDYGLVEGLLQPLYSGADCYVLSPLTLLKRPLRWLEAIDRYGATHSHAPNFAYELCLQRISEEQREGLDLSKWRVAGNGAELVRADTLERFTEAFAPQGFRAETFYPAYGLAEATLFVTARSHDQLPRSTKFRADALEQHLVIPLQQLDQSTNSRTVVSCGSPHPGTDLRIVNSETSRVCDPDQVGEVWFSGPSVALGYWNRLEESDELFAARLADDPNAGPFLRTGDLGFLLGGELHITGRIKDLIIIGGVNHYPNDIEWTVVHACPELRRDHCAAFAVEQDGEERLVILAEAERQRDDWSSVFQRLLTAVNEQHEIAIAEIIILKRGGIFKTSSGKLQRGTCRQAFLKEELDSIANWRPRRFSNKPSSSGPSVPADLQRWLCEKIAARLSLDPNRIDINTPFSALGLDSRAAVALVGELEDMLEGPELSPTLLWHYPTILALTGYLKGISTVHADGGYAASIHPGTFGREPGKTNEPVAIVGLACRFPGSENSGEFWSLLRDGRCAVDFSDRMPGVEAGFLDGIENFDAGFFGLSENEARGMDPQQRLLLEVAWEAMEDFGLAPQDIEGARGGVFVGISAADHALQNFSRSDSEQLINAYSATGFALSLAANRLSYHLNFHGPSLAIDTACSSSLVAVHQACQSLRHGECDIALAGGVNLIGNPHVQLALERAGMLSPNSRCNTFDAAADGYVRGEGCGIVVLKPLEAARRDGNRILAVILGSAVNQDGRSNGLTAPNPEAQKAVIRQALGQASIPPSTIDYIEAHGTGTRLGDPIEVEALQAVLGEARPSGSICHIGSVKGNIGHLEAAAGIAGLIKTIQCLRYGEIPPQPHLQNLNPLIKLEGTHFSIPTSSQAWQNFMGNGAQRPRRAAVSSFGFGGTNAHVILEQAPVVAEIDLRDEPDDQPLHLFPLSAHSTGALRAAAERYSSFLRAAPEINLTDLCFTVGTHRAQHQHRLAVVAPTTEVLREKLYAFAVSEASSSGLSAEAPLRPSPITFLFSGQGSQCLNMGKGLYDTEPSFRAVLDECDKLLEPHLDRSLLSVMYGKDEELLGQTRYTQPALFVLEYALARLWRDWGIEPAALLGHSIGEYAAACLAGVFDLEVGLRLVAARGRLTQSLPLDGAMLALAADEDRLKELITSYAGSVSIAAVNAPRRVVLSGRRVDLEQLLGLLQKDGIHGQFLSVSHAFHSPLLDPILEPFHDLASSYEYSKPNIPLISNLDGQVLQSAPDADYWTRHLRDTVRFQDGIESLADTCRVFLEIGPKPTLASLGAQTLGDLQCRWLASLRPGEEDWSVLLGSFSDLYRAGAMPDWESFYRGPNREQIYDLPSYPFQRSHFGMPPRSGVSDSGTAVLEALGKIHEASHDSRSRRNASAPATNAVEEWGFVPRWLPVSSRAEDTHSDWLLLADQKGAASALDCLLGEVGEACTYINGPLTSALPSGDDVLTLVCFWGLDLLSPSELAPESFADALEFFSDRLLVLVKRLAEQADRPHRLWFITRGVCGADTESEQVERASLLQSLVLGFARSLREEQPHWSVRLIDIEGTPDLSAQQILAESRSAESYDEVRWRGMERSALALEPCTLDSPGALERFEGSWLLSGGSGRLGLAMASRLVQRGVRHLLLIGRGEPNTDALERIAELRNLGATVETRTVDVADFIAVKELFDNLPPGWPALQGVIHAAGVLDDAVFHRYSAKRIAAVLAPKVSGGWNLHCLTKALPIRHFLLISSASGLLGNPGQAAYCAANSFLDALAVFRRGQGLPAQSQSWSAWADAADDPKVSQQLQRHGLAPVDPEQGLLALERALSLDVSHIALLPRNSVGRLIHPLFRSLEEVPSTPMPNSELLDEIRGLPIPERSKLLQDRILELAASMRGVDAEALDPQRGFFEQGLDSMNTVELRNRLQNELGLLLPTTLAFDYPTPVRLVARLLVLADLNDPVHNTSTYRSNNAVVDEVSDGIAIIGLSCRLPGGVTDPNSFWALLRDGVDAITEVPGSRWDIERFFSTDPNEPGTIQSRYGGFVDAVEYFDPVFFGISPREAEHLDPQHRLLLEVCWEALEHAGIPPSSLEESETGVFVGISTNDYLQRLNRQPTEIDAYLGTGNALSVAANRLSYTLGLEGPSLAIDTACSSSLVAIHQACQSLRVGESELAICGGVNLLLDPTVSINHSRARMLAPDGRCKAFAAEADGFVRSEGCALIVLKKLSDAERDSDRILGVIRGSAVNQDGRTSGLTVPSGLAQQRVIHRALKQAKLAPSDIDYIETHGTGTALGDPIEAGALDAVFGNSREGEHPNLTIGSVKSNVGHLEAAAGIAGLQKVVLALGQRQIPANLHCLDRNPDIDWTNSVLRVPMENETWPDKGRPRRAGVSSFGFGGTNAHIVVEEAPSATDRSPPDMGMYLLPLSAKSEAALRNVARRMLVCLNESQELLADLCFTASCGRDHFNYRLAVLGGDNGELCDGLRAWLDGRSANNLRHGTVARSGDALPVQGIAAGSVSPDRWPLLADQYVCGNTPDWHSLYEGLPLRRVDLPGYPFERQRYWIASDSAPEVEPTACTLHWIPAADYPPIQPQFSGHWLILADKSGFALSLSKFIESRGARCTLVCRATDVAVADDMGRDLKSDDEEGFQALLDELGPLLGIVHLWGLDEPEVETLDVERLLARQQVGVASLPAMVRVLQRRERPPRLWLVTQDAVSAVPGDRLNGLAQTPIWGFGRSLALEAPHIWGGLIDMPAVFDRERAAVLVAGVLTSMDLPESQIAIRAGSILVPRLQPWIAQSQTAFSIKSDVSYLITGAFGSLGRALALWLAQQGARSLWLISRSGAASQTAKGHVEALIALGVTVNIAALDVADTVSLSRQVATWCHSGPPLRGVFHAAGQTGRAGTDELSWQDCSALLAAKMEGGWALHQATIDEPLDFFVGCSSIASLWGGQQQAAYSAANSFLDGLAAYRRARSQAGSSINIGPVAGSAMVSETAEIELRRMGLVPFRMDSLMSRLPDVLADIRAQIACVAVDWTRFAPLYQSRCSTGLFDAFLLNAETRNTEPAPRSNLGGILHRELASNGELRDWLTVRLAEALHVPEGRIDPDIPLPRLGLDSLLAMELRNRIERELGMSIPLPELLGGESLNALISRLELEMTRQVRPATIPDSEHTEVNFVGGAV